MKTNNRPTHVFLKCAQDKSEWVAATPLSESGKDENGAMEFKACFPCSESECNTVKSLDGTIIHQTRRHKSDEAFIVRLDWSDQDSKNSSQ
jgi:hypothetical protein